MEITLAGGHIAIIDDEDFEKVSKIKWYLDKGKKDLNYAIGWLYEKDSNGIKLKRKNVKMHRIIMGVKDSSVYIDHKDHNGLNNQKSNLRECNSSQNTMNSRQTLNRSSEYKGVVLVKWKGVNKNTDYWKAGIKINGKYKALGTFKCSNPNSEITAALCYDKAAIKQFGVFACVNFPKLKIESNAG